MSIVVETVICNQDDCVNHHDGRCEARRLVIQDQECLTYRCRYIDYDEEEE